MSQPIEEVRKSLDWDDGSNIREREAIWACHSAILWLLNRVEALERELADKQPRTRVFG